MPAITAAPATTSSPTVNEDVDLSSYGMGDLVALVFQSESWFYIFAEPLGILCGMSTAFLIAQWNQNSVTPKGKFLINLLGFYLPQFLHFLIWAVLAACAKSYHDVSFFIWMRLLLFLFVYNLVMCATAFICFVSTALIIWIIKRSFWKRIDIQRQGLLALLVISGIIFVSDFVRMDGMRLGFHRVLPWQAAYLAIFYFFVNVLRESSQDHPVVDPAVMPKATSLYHLDDVSIELTVTTFLAQILLFSLYANREFDVYNMEDEDEDENGRALWYWVAVVIILAHILREDTLNVMIESAVFWGRLFRADRDSKSAFGNRVPLVTRMFADVCVNVVMIVFISLQLPYLAARESEHNLDFVLNIVAILFLYQIDDLSPEEHVQNALAL